MLSDLDAALAPGRPRRAWLLACAGVLTLGCHKSTDGYEVPPVLPPPDAYVPCGLVTCASLSATCGPIGDGCGGALSCGTCAAPEVCGGGAGTAFTCGDNPCVPRACSDAGADCGQIADGCGGLTASCGSCAPGSICGGGGVPNVCAATPCTGLCQQQSACAGQPATTITGRVTAPGHATTAPFGMPDPISGALVYIPNGAAGPPTYGVTAFPAGVSCDTCSSLVSGTPLVTATTAADGTFTLHDAPCGTNIPLVMQLGRWRRQIAIPSVACCATTALTGAQTHLPRNHVGEPGDVRSDIPLMAFSTGDVDTLHCVLRKVGIDDAEFSNPGGTGRVRFYTDTGARIDAATPPAATLYDSAAELAKYDMALFECVGTRVPKTATEQKHVIDFANAGGRVFATHFGYVWLTDSDGTPGSNLGPIPFSQTADWNVDQGFVPAATAIVETSLQGDPETRARRSAFAQWLQLVGAATTPGQISVNTVRRDFDGVTSVPATANGAPAQLWLSMTVPSAAPITYTFDTPVAYPPTPRPSQRCGRVMYSDFHVSDALSAGATFPAECTDGPMTPQEKTLEFMLFDLAACTGPQPSTCSPRTCAELGYNCGLTGDGCDDGAVQSCGSCTNGRTCGGGGPGVCGTGACTPITCASLDGSCGIIGDGCGGTVYCGTCKSGEACGGVDTPNQCQPIIVK